MSRNEKRVVKALAVTLAILGIIVGMVAIGHSEMPYAGKLGCDAAVLLGAALVTAMTTW